MVELLLSLKRHVEKQLIAAVVLLRRCPTKGVPEFPTLFTLLLLFVVYRLWAPCGQISSYKHRAAPHICPEKENEASAACCTLDQSSRFRIVADFCFGPGVHSDGSFCLASKILYVSELCPPEKGLGPSTPAKHLRDLRAVTT